MIRQAILGATIAAFAAPVAQAQDAYIGEIREFALDFCPKGWAPANGASVQIAQNAPLFSLLGTRFGGDGVRTFNLPNITPTTTAATSTQLAGGEARIYEHCDLEGWNLPLGLGDFRPGDLRAPYSDNNVSSVLASPGWQVTLFDGPNFDGESVTVTGQETCLVASNFNDRTSSIRVTRAPAGTAAVASKTQTCIATQGLFPSRN